MRDFSQLKGGMAQVAQW